MCKRGLDLKVHNHCTSADGRSLIMDVSINGTRFTLMNIYAPNEDGPEFFANIFNEKQCQHRTSTEWAEMGHVRNVPNDTAFSKIRLTTQLDAVSFGTLFFY